MIFTRCTPFITVSQKRDINVFCRKKLVILMYRQSPEIFFMPLLRHIWQYRLPYFLMGLKRKSSRNVNSSQDKEIQYGLKFLHLLIRFMFRTKVHIFLLLLCCAPRNQTIINFYKCNATSITIE